MIIKKIYPRRDSWGWYFYPPLSSFKFDIDNIELTQAAGENKQVIMYIHIPFCISFCAYCCFCRIKVEGNEELMIDYIDALEREIKMYAGTDYIQSLSFGAVHFGGGTPSCLSTNQLERLVKLCKKEFNICSDSQITVECNSASLDTEKLERMMSLGVNRISIGVQTFNDNIGRKINLVHDSAMVKRIIEKVKEAGYQNIGIDLIYNLPGQTLKGLVNDLETAINIGVNHIAIYCLKLLPDTVLTEQIKNKEVTPIESLKAIKMYKTTMKVLRKAGFRQESLIDFAKSGSEGFKYGRLRANSRDTLGLGVNSFGYINHTIYQNNSSINEYITAIKRVKYPVISSKKISLEEEMHGFMALGLRFIGISKMDFKDRFGINIEDKFSDRLQRLKKKKLIKITDNNVELTDLGIIWAGNVSNEFYSTEIKTMHTDKLDEVRKEIDNLDE